MKIEDENFETEVSDGLFNISVSGDGDCSYDGGYSFETVTNTAELTKIDAERLIAELQDFVNNKLTG